MRVEEVFDRVVARFIGTKHERDIKRIAPLVVAINALEPEMQGLSDLQLAARTPELKAQVEERLAGLEADDPQFKQPSSEWLRRSSQHWCRHLRWRAKRAGAS